MTRTLLSLLLVACGASSVEEAAPATIPAQEYSTVDEIEIPEGTRRPLPEVILLDAGQMPHEPLRYSYQLGQQEIVATVSTGFQTSEMTVDLPEMTMVFDKHVALVDSRGWARVEATLAHIQVTDGPGAEEMRGATQNMIGSQYWSIVCRRGFERARGGAMADQSGTVPSMVFPREPVGVGAQWQNRSQMANGATNVTTYTLRSVEGTRLNIDIQVEQSGDNITLNGTGGFAVQGTGSGQTMVDIQDGTTNGQAAITMNFTGPATIQSTARTTFRASARVPND